jgi:hypothetical protein
MLVVFVAAGIASAQPSHVHIWSLEARIAEADAVVVGPIVKVHRKVIAAPNQRQPNGEYEYAPAVKAEEVLKGDIKGVVDDLGARWSLSEDRRYEQWMKAGNSILWFLGPTPKPGQKRVWHYVVFGKEVPAEAYFGGRREPPMYAMDFTILKNEKEVLDRARAYAKTSTKVLPTHSIRFSSPWHDLIVPVEPALEKTAKRLLDSPQDFLQKGEELDPRLRYTLRSSGVSALRHFKSKENAELLRSLLDEPLEDFESSLVRQHPVRVIAFEVLLQWGVETRLPKDFETVKFLDLTGFDVPDGTLKEVAKLQGLTGLELHNAKFTDKGLKQLTNLKRLTWIGLDEKQMSDATLRALREAGLLHAVAAASAKDGKRPTSAAEVVSLALCRGPLTDAGLKELSELKNMTWLDLRDTQITDAGLTELVGLKNLTRLLLQGTRVTDAGIAVLHKALPKCEISR